MENPQIADLLEEIADLIELQGGNHFRIRSYRAAARAVRDHPTRLEDVVGTEDLTEIPHIGTSTAEKIGEILETGTCPQLEELRKQVPKELTEFLQIPQVGPRTAMQIHRELGIQTLEELEEACRKGLIRELSGLGAKTEQTILEGIAMLKKTADRFLRSTALTHLDSLGAYLGEIDTIERWVVAGSFRRQKETIGDLDILLMADDRSQTTKRILQYPEIGEVLGRGNEKISIRLKSGLQIDFRFFVAEDFGAALIYFTGSKAHNIEIRKRAQQKAWKLNEYGLFQGDHRLAGRTEEAVYRRLSLSWIPPELRENRGEVEAASRKALPSLIDIGDLRGDLHAHTTASDGHATIAEMAQAALRRGYEYLAITDHSKKVTVAGGLNDDEVRRHADEVRRIDADLKGLWLMAGVEVDILETGRLDLAEETLAELDWVVASIHYNMHLNRRQNTDRIVRAISSGVVHCIGHPLGRIIGKREPMSFDLERVFEACHRYGVCLEINAQPDRLDLSDPLCKRAMEAGVEFTISSDAHRTSDLALVKFGVGVARRGWLECKHVLNTRSAEQLRNRLGRLARQEA